MGRDNLHEQSGISIASEMVTSSAMDIIQLNSITSCSSSSLGNDLLKKRRRQRKFKGRKFKISNNVPSIPLVEDISTNNNSASSVILLDAIMDNDNKATPPIITHSLNKLNPHAISFSPSGGSSSLVEVHHSSSSSSTIASSTLVSSAGQVSDIMAFPASSLPGSFSKSSTVQHFIQQMVTARTFSLAGIKRAMVNFIHASTTPSIAVVSTVSVGIPKPNGLHINEMFDAKLFQHGTTPLPEDSYPLKPTVMWNHHRQLCPTCSNISSWMDTSCYFKSMLLCITHGWHPPIELHRISPKYVTLGNYPTIDQFPESVAKEFSDMLSHGVVVPFNDFHSSPFSIINPLGAIIKNSDKIRAQTQVGITIKDQSSLSTASQSLISMGLPKIKSRIITDVTATGINGAAYSPPFRYPSFQDGLRLISKGCFMGKTDVGRYFHSFPLATLVRALFLLGLAGQLYSYARCFFGFTSCPYYASTWSAEFRQWILPLVPNTTHMMDDWLTAGDTLSAAEANIAIIENLFRSIGFYIADDKREFGQRLTFLGVLIDSNKMTMSFDPVQVTSVLSMLTNSLPSIRTFRHLPKATVEHICGKLNWYSEVVQSGRLHLRSWWSYLRFGTQLSSVLHARLVSDTLWWMDLLQQWASSTHGGVEYRILSASELLADPHSIYIIQSDASGTDGFGYYSGYYQDLELSYVSKPWAASRASWTASQFSSHSDELEALADFLINCSISNCLLVWITDSQSAAFSVLKGSCHEPRGFDLLTTIFRICDQRHLQLMALWVPRDHNELADYLSHLASYLHRDSVAGSLSSLATSSSVYGEQQSTNISHEGY